MSEAASVPFSETKAPESPDRLNRGALRLVDISASTMANIGPAYSFYFGAGFLFLTAGIAAPLTIIVAGIAIALLGNTLSQFSRAHPSTGGFISYVGKTFGGTSAVTTALLCGAGYIIAISSVLAICGGYLSMVLQYYFNVEHAVGHLLGDLHRRRDVHDVPRRGRVHQAGRAVLRLRDAGADRGVGRRAHQERRAPVRGAVRAQPHHQRLQRPGGRVPARHLPVHRLGELRRAGRGDRQPPAQRAAGGVPVDRADGDRLRPVRVRHRHRVQVQRHRAQRRRHPVHQRVARHRRVAVVVRLDRRHHLHPRRADLRGELAGPADLQRRPGGAAAALARQGAPDAAHAGQRDLRVRRHRGGDHRWSGRCCTWSAATAAR